MAFSQRALRYVFCNIHGSLPKHMRNIRHIPYIYPLRYVAPILSSFLKLLPSSGTSQPKLSYVRSDANTAHRKHHTSGGSMKDAKTMGTASKAKATAEKSTA